MSMHDMPDMPPMYNGNNTMMNMNMVMQMNFFWGKNVTVLFKGWPDNHLGMYILSLFFVFFLAFAVEILSMAPIIKRTVNPIAGGMIQAGIYTARMILVYFVMLSVMSFNIGIFIVAIIGHGLGYFFVKFRELTAASKAEITGSNGTDPKV